MTPYLTKIGSSSDAQVDRRAVALGVRVERVMEVADLPVLARVAQRAVEPFELPPIHQRAVEREEADVVARVGVVALAVHVVRLVGHLLGPIVIAERGLELHARRRAAARTAARTS